MAEPKPPQLDPESAEIRKRAIRRAIVAGVLVVAAVVALTLLNHRKPVPAPEAEPAPASPRARAAEPPAAPDKAPEPEAVPAEPAETLPEKPQPAPLAETLPPPPPSVVAPAAAPAAPAHKSVVSRVAPMPQEAPAPVTTARLQKSPVAGKAPESTPVAAPEVARSAPPAVKPLADVPPAKGYVVQLGLFANPANAQQLQARLAEHGIKTYTETRLNIGPFTDKAEADAALAKVKALGVNAVIAPAR